VHRNSPGLEPAGLVAPFRFALESFSLGNQEAFVIAWPDGTDNAWNIGPRCARAREATALAISAIGCASHDSTETSVAARRVEVHRAVDQGGGGPGATCTGRPGDGRRDHAL